jgi:hypothetical protein
LNPRLKPCLPKPDSARAHAGQVQIIAGILLVGCLGMWLKLHGEEQAKH